MLCGAVAGHPILSGTGRVITTSPLHLLDPVQGWARTYSRLYRLGRPAGDARHQAERFQGDLIMAIDFKRYRRPPARPGDRNSRIYKRAVKARRRAEKAFAPSLGGPVADALVYAVVRRALRPVADLWQDLPVVVALDLPEGIAAEQVTTAFDRIDSGIPSKDGAGLRSTTATISAEAFRSKSRKGGASSLRREILREIRGHRRVVLAIEAGLAVPQDVVPLLDHRIALTDRRRRRSDVSSAIDSGSRRPLTPSPRSPAFRSVTSA